MGRASYLLPVAVLAALAGLPAAAATVAVSVADASGQPLSDAVVSLAPADGGPLPAGIAPTTDRKPAMRQKGEQFDPFILAVQVGTQVAFPNEDPVRHHVFSFSTPKPFELRLYGRDVVPTVTFDKPGVIALGCNIHDHMRSYIYVVDTPLFASSDATGLARVTGTPPGRYLATIWHPRIKGQGNRITREVTVAGPADPPALRVDVAVAAAPKPSPPDPERGSY